MTPEAKVKQKVNKLLDKYGSGIYRYMPVPGGYGKSTLDYLCSFHGLFFAIETKRRAKDLTERQQGIREDIEASGARVFRVRDDAELADLGAWLDSIHRLWGGEKLTRQELAKIDEP